MDHAILLGKLKLYGVDYLSLNGFGPPYLTESSKPLAQSDFCNVTCGIPQGSILRPLLSTIT